jgi:MacB-like periplasmic core domain
MFVVEIGAALTTIFLVREAQSADLHDLGAELPVVERAVQRLRAHGRIWFCQFTLVGGGEPEQFTGGTLTPSLFPLLGIKPVLGRSFADGEDRPGSAKVVMISEALWKRRFGGEASIVGRHLPLNGADYMVVGIAPASLGLLSTGDMWIPMTIDPGREVNLGFQPDRLLTFQLSLPQTKYPVDKAAVFYRTLLESLDSIPGVRCAAVSSGLPFGAGNYTTTPIATTGPSPLPPDTAVATDWRIVSPRFFHTMNIPLVHGRDFVDTDSIGPPQVVIVSQATARRFWGSSDPLRRTLHRQGDSKQFTVVGVLG